MLCASHKYPDGFGGYDDSPKYVPSVLHFLLSSHCRYTWDSEFTFESFRDKIAEYNRSVANNLDFQIHVERTQNVTVIFKSGIENDTPSIARMRYSTDVDEALEPKRDLMLPLMAPVGFVHFAVEVLQAVYADHGVPYDNVLDIKAALDDKGPPHGDVLIFWRIDTFAMWQQVDRRMDEYAFHLPYFSMP